MLDVDRTSAPTTTLRQDLMTVLVGTWLMFGLFLDGYAHDNILTGTESFLTPWHGVFYSGFTATAGWILYLVARRVRSGIPAARAVPRGYGWAVIGIVIFAVGGIGDATWHTLFGIETGLDALFSPTHMLLFAGLFLIITAPFKAAWSRPDEGTVSWGRFFPAWLSITLASALMGFFVAYLWMPYHEWLALTPFDPVTDDGSTAVALGTGSMLVTTLILVAPTLHVLRRWRPPLGSFIVMWGVVNWMIAAAFGPEATTISLVTGAAGGVAIDGLLYLMRHRDAVSTARVVAAAGPLVMWLVFFGLVSSKGPLGWTLEVWTGSAVLAALAGLGASMLVFSQPSPGSVAHADR